MAETKKTGAGKRYGSRYGRHLRDKVAEIESGYRGRSKCPYCGKKRVKRLAVGIWKCNSCDNKFTGRAYGLSKKVVVQQQVDEVEEKEEVKNNE